MPTDDDDWHNDPVFFDSAEEALPQSQGGAEPPPPKAWRPGARGSAPRRKSSGQFKVPDLEADDATPPIEIPLTDDASIPLLEDSQEDALLRPPSESSAGEPSRRPVRKRPPSGKQPRPLGEGRARSGKQARPPDGRGPSGRYRRPLESSAGHQALRRTPSGGQKLPPVSGGGRISGRNPRPSDSRGARSASGRNPRPATGKLPRSSGKAARPPVAKPSAPARPRRQRLHGQIAPNVLAEIFARADELAQDGKPPEDLGARLLDAIRSRADKLEESAVIEPTPRDAPATGWNEGVAERPPARPAASVGELGRSSLDRLKASLDGLAWEWEAPPDDAELPPAPDVELADPIEFEGDSDEIEDLLLKTYVRYQGSRVPGQSARRDYTLLSPDSADGQDLEAAMRSFDYGGGGGGASPHGAGLPGRGRPSQPPPPQRDLTARLPLIDDEDDVDPDARPWWA